MKKRDPALANILKEIKDLKKSVQRVLRDLNYETSRSARKYLTEELSFLKNQLGWALLDAGEFDKGLSVYQSLSWRTDGEEKYNGIARALTEMGYYEDAGRILVKGLKRFPKSGCMLVAMGLIHRRLGYDVDALRYFKQAIKCSPGDRHALYDKALTLSDLGYYEDSLSIVSKLIKKYPDDPDYLVETGYCHLMMGYPEKAVEFYKKAADTGCLSSSIYGGLVCAYMDMGLKHEALETALEGMREFPEEPGMYENLGEAYFEYGWIDEAKGVLQEGLEKFPDNEGIRKILDKIEDDEKDPDKGNRPSIGTLLILLALIMKKLGKKL